MTNRDFWIAVDTYEALGFDRDTSVLLAKTDKTLAEAAKFLSRKAKR